MGQAKRRGTFEERRQQSIDRTEAERMERKRQAQEWGDSLTPEQQEAEREKSRKRERDAATAGMWMMPLMSYGLPYTMQIPYRRRR
jgi:hypothetical protein